MPESKFEKDAVAIFMALSDTTRYNIVRMLLSVEEASCAHVSMMFPLSSPAMSHHFRVLEQCDLMETRKQGLRRFFRINRTLLGQFLPNFEDTHGYPREEVPA